MRNKMGVSRQKVEPTSSFTRSELGSASLFPQTIKPQIREKQSKLGEQIAPLLQRVRLHEVVGHRQKKSSQFCRTNAPIFCPLVRKYLDSDCDREALCEDIQKYCQQ
jgi:hypothetical protein